MWRHSNAAVRGNQRDAQVALLDMPREMCAHFEVGGTLGSFVGQSNSVQTILIQSDGELIRKLVSVLDNQLLAVLETRSVLEFAQMRAETWPRYVRARRALSDTMTNLAPEGKMEFIVKEIVATQVEDFQKQRGVRFGDALTDQAVFTLWTMGKINALVQMVNGGGEPRDRDADLKLNSEYQLCLLWAQFHLDAAVAAIKFKKTVPEDIQGAICDGLRAAVNAYAILKEAMLLRTPIQNEAPLATPLPWDNEDEQLLASSMRDMNANLSDDRH